MADLVTIVLDPGHGGENHGLTHNGYLEKEMNLSVAQTMKEELEKYEGVSVHITNPECIDMSLKERAEFAKSVEADILISLHFNMSESHRSFGSEVWIPSKGENYGWMHSLGDLFLEEFKALGLHSRGVKTRLNDRGTDYYGVIRESEALGVPSLLVEHCYADASQDASILSAENSLTTFGVRDATAVAKFFRLKSDVLGVDYSDYVKNAYFSPEEARGIDETPPEEIVLHYIETEEEVHSFLLQAHETETALCYYDYSLDGGESWSELYAWEEGTEAVTFEIDEVTADAVVMARAYNNYAVSGESNVISFAPDTVALQEAEKAAEEEAKQKEEMEAKKTETASETVKEWESHPVLQVAKAGQSVSAILALLLGVYVLVSKYQKKQTKVRVGGIGCVSCIVLAVMLGVFSYRFQSEMENAALAVVSTDVEAMAEMENAKKALDDSINEIPIPAMYKEGNLLAEAEAESLLTTAKQEKTKEIVYDIARGYLSVDSLPTMARNSYDFSRIQEKDGLKYYYDEAGNLASMVGVDVSKFQGNIDWEKVKNDGIEFAILRLGLRGYGSGELVTDEKFYANLEGAQSVGLPVGAYFFSAAVNEEEAVEEADYVAQVLSGYQLELPVVFDTEPILYDDARTDGLTPRQLTKITRAFCDRIKALGYEPMIYANAKRFTTALYLEELKDIPVWYADYQEKPIYPYPYQMWQYTEKGSVDGIEGNVDIDLYFKM